MNAQHVRCSWWIHFNLVLLFLQACGGGAPGVQRITADVTYPDALGALRDQLTVEANLYRESTLSSASRVAGPISGEAAKADRSQLAFAIDGVEAGKYYLQILFRQQATSRQRKLSVNAQSASNIAACPAEVVERVFSYCAAAGIWPQCVRTLTVECDRLQSGEQQSSHKVAVGTKPDSARCEETLWVYARESCEPEGVERVDLCHAIIHDACASDSVAESEAAVSPTPTVAAESGAILASLIAVVQLNAGQDVLGAFLPASFYLNYDDNQNGLSNLSEATILSGVSSIADPAISDSDNESAAVSPSPTPIASFDVPEASSSPSPVLPSTLDQSPAPSSASNPSSVPTSSPNPVSTNSSVAPTASPVAKPVPPTLTWTARESGAVVDLQGIAYGNGTFVGVGPYGNIITSIDGQGWTQTESGSPADHFQQLEFGVGAFSIASGSSFHRSLDGNEWTTGQTTDFYILGLAAGTDRMVAVGSTFSSDDARHALFLTETGWQSHTGGVPYNLNDVAWGDGHFVAVGDYGTILTSEDGLNWTAQASGTLSHLWSVGYHAGKFLVYTTSTQLLSSNDGAVWSAVKPSIALYFTYHSRMASHGGLLLAGGYDAVYTSLDGTAWAKTALNMPPQFPKSVSYRSIAWDGKTLVMVGDYGAVFTAPWSGTDVH